MKAASSDLKMAIESMFVFAVVVLVLTLPDIAQASLYLDTVLCNGAGLFHNRAGQGIATIGISILGVGALLGKISWGLAMIVGVGTALLFGASTIVYQISGYDGCY